MAQTSPPAYKNAKLPTAARVADLLKRMTLEEKVAQLYCHWESSAQRKIFVRGKLSETQLALVAPHGLGQVGRPSEGSGVPSEGFGGGNLSKGLDAYQTAAVTNQIQKYFVEKTRLGVPVLFHEESLHGNQAKDATVFPSHLALGSTWNETLLTDIYTSVAAEVRLRGGHHVLAPVVDLARDPRWGRTEECLGEDPYHVGRLAVAEIKAYQGGAKVERIGARHVVATLKHFGVHGAPEGGINVAPSFVDERTLREVYLPPFEACVRQGGSLGLMPAYNELSGIPAHANRWLLTSVLRGEWGFKGVVVSDYSGVSDLYKLHHVAADTAEAAAQALRAGVDIEAPNGNFYPSLVKLVKAGKLPVALIDQAAARVLTLKFNLGLFEQPYIDPEEARRVVGSAEHRTIARRAAQEAMVLLKNEGNLLPLAPGKYRRVAIIGPNADRCILGGYADQPKQVNTPLQALRQRLGPGTEIVYAEGVRLTDEGNWFSDPVKPTSSADNAPLIREAVEKCRTADLILYFGGSSEAIYREAWSKTHMGDRPDIDLFGDQNALLLELAKLNKPLAGFVFSGPPLACNALNDHAQALVQCWYLGQETGDAVADLVLGTINPSGKLPITIPRSVGHIPAYYSYKPSARRGLSLADVLPLYPFGHGLSYTTFGYQNLRISAPKISRGQSVTVQVDVANTGKVAGAEVVQLYVRDLVSSVTRPVKELKDFAKITLKPGETRTVRFTLTPDKLSFWNQEMKRVVEPGEFEVMVGTSSAQTQAVRFEMME
ncbi:MAG: glycoside hydrolase family 3 C-terminal domain-containing protein [Hymenobacter sp.]|nr:glycoside hydrolase family 3 C-terminal domain-containing protein [Hymenobacter sp.]